MMMDVNLAKINDQSGQALIELIIFLPMMFILYGLVSGFAQSINGSINQQKVTRAYFYYRIQNNSYIPKPDEGSSHTSWNNFGMFFIGWKDYFTGSDIPVMPCYSVTVPLKGSNGSEKCDEKYTTTTSKWIRVGTVYGICGATYAFRSPRVLHLPDNQTSFEILSDWRGCIIE